MSRLADLLACCSSVYRPGTSWGRFRTHFAAILVLAATTQHSWADSSSLDLQWEAPAPCPDGRAVAQEVALLEGRRATLSALHVEARVAQQPDGTWSATLRTNSHGATGERTFSASECGQLASAAALIIALAHCPELASVAPSDERPAPPESPLEVWAGALAAGDLGSQPAPAFGAGAEFAIHFGHLGVRLHALRNVSQRALRGPSADSSIDVQALVGLGLRGCWYPLDARWLVGACLGVDGWLINTASNNVSVASQGSGWWLGPMGGTQLSFKIFERLLLTMSVEVGVAATRPVFVIDGYGAVFRANAVVGRLRGGLEVRLW